MTEAELLVAKFNAETERVIYTTQEAWEERGIEMSCVGGCNGQNSVRVSCIYATPIAFS